MRLRRRRRPRQIEATDIGLGRVAGAGGVQLTLYDETGAVLAFYVLERKDVNDLAKALRTVERVLD